jgi:hypothetical protein
LIGDAGFAPDPGPCGKECFVRQIIRAAAVLSVFAASAAYATVNHGDFLGTSVDFLQVEETTQSAGDPEPLWEAPVLAGTGDQLAFFPTAYISQCNAGTSDTTSSLLEVTIEAHAGGSLDRIAFQENGDATLTTFPPFGAPRRTWRRASAASSR